MNKRNWHSLNTKEVLEVLRTSTHGLSEDDAKQRLKENGKNILPKRKKDGILQIFINQLINPIIFILVVTTILSFIIGEYVDGIFVTIVILLDAVLGTIQEWKAGKNAESLQKLIKVEAKVLRNFKEVKIDSELLVLGDIVLLEPGDKISADLRLISSYNLSIDEAILTGESVAALKNSNLISEDSALSNRNNMAYAGTSVVTGRGMGVIVSTGIDTEIGQIANKVILTDDIKSPLVIRMEKFTKQIGVFVAITAIIITFLLYSKGNAPQTIFFSVVALSISAIPEGLPVALTLALSIASNRMAKKNVIVKKLNSVESLGSCTVIASDKTGTLTLNEQTAKKILLPSGVEFHIEGTGYNGLGKVIVKENEYEQYIKELGKLGVLNNEGHLDNDRDDWYSYGDSIDVAFLALGYKLNIKTKEEYKELVVGNIPYESEQKYSAVFYKEDDLIYCSVKGSLEKVLEFCDYMQFNDEKKTIDKQLIIKQNEDLATRGYRVIALAKGLKKDFTNKVGYEANDIPRLTLVGLIGFIDPIRKETVSAIKECKSAGIKVVMITGDHPLTAFSIAKELSIVNDYSEVSVNDEIDNYFKLGQEQFDRFIKTKKVFSRVTPIQKLEIVESYKRQGEFIAVTGDGVNDAPAMKSANIGIAMGSGTDVAKETGTMIITDDNFLSIVSGIEEGRNAYNNVRKVIYLLISTGVAEILFFILSIIFNYPMPLVAIQLLWLNLVTNGIQDAALAFEKGEDGVMNKKPRNPKERIFNRLLIEETFVSGLVMGMVVFVVWIYLIGNLNLQIENARGHILLLMVFMQNLHVFNCRSESKSAFKVPLRNNLFIIIGVLSVLLLQIVVSETPFLSEILKTTTIPVKDVFIMFLLATPVLFTMEIYKKIKREKKKF